MRHIKNHKTKRPITMRHLRKFRKIQNKTIGIFNKNPILIYGLALPVAVVPSTSLSSGISLCVAMLIVYLPTLLVAAYIGENLSQWQRTLLYPCLSAGLLAPARLAVRSISPTVFDSLGIYFSLICVSTLLAIGIEQAVKLREKPKAVLKFGIFNWLGFSFIILIVSIIRELIGSGTLWGVAMPFIKLPVPGVLIACSGFILLGFLAAGGRLVHRIFTGVILQAYSLQTAQTIQPVADLLQTDSSGKKVD